MSIFDDLDLGSGPNQDDGDELRAGGQKINDNFAKAANKEEDNTFEGNIVVDKFLQIGAIQIITIASGAITVTSSYVRLTGEGLSADDLDTINSSATDGTIIILRIAAEVITVTENGNIELGATTRVLSHNQDRLMLHYDGTKWSEISYSDNS